MDAGLRIYVWWGQEVQERLEIEGPFDVGENQQKRAERQRRHSNFLSGRRTDRLLADADGRPRRRRGRRLRPGVAAGIARQKLQAAHSEVVFGRPRDGLLGVASSRGSRSQIEAGVASNQKRVHS